MKVVHTFASQNIIWKERMYIQMLSALYAKKHYGNIHLYTTEMESEQILKVGIPYTSINTKLLNEVDCKQYSLAKIYTYKEIQEPFLHIDTDSIFFSKFDFDQIKSSFLFSHPDMKHLSNLKGTLGEHIPFLINNKDEKLNSHNHFWINHVYLKLYIDLFDKHSTTLKTNFNFTHIPNMSIVLVRDFKNFKIACEQSIDHYFENKEIIDKQEMGPCYIEQLMIHQYLLSGESDYKELVKNDETFLFKDVPLSITLETQSKTNASIYKTEFPFNFRTTSRCLCCNEQKLNEHSIDSIEDIKKILNFKFFGYTHFSFMQWYQLWQVIVINEIVETFGEEYAINIHNSFIKSYSNLNLPIYSEAELLYEKLTGRKIFTKKSNII
jgi:hypothetical protein